MWVVKGGMAIELRIGDSARMTKDLDLNLRTDSEGAPEAHQRLSAAASTDPTGDGFLFELSEPSRLEPVAAPGTGSLTMSASFSAG